MNKNDINASIATRAGFVAAIGRPNAGKSTLLNHLLGEELALVSRKANATRKQLQMIVPYTPLNAQIIFVDTPGLHHKEKLLNQYMLSQALKAMSDCDILLYLAPVSDGIESYVEFLTLSKNKAHILLLTKTDTCTKEQLLSKIAQYQAYEEHFLALLPVSVQKGFDKSRILHTIASFLPYSPFFYDESLLSPALLKDIYKEIIRESLFEKLGDEIPYESDVLITQCNESLECDRIYANIIVEKQSQKAMVIGKSGSSIKRIGIYAREKMMKISGKKIYLQLNVEARKGWSRQKALLKKIGYDIT